MTKCIVWGCTNDVAAGWEPGGFEACEEHCEDRFHIVWHANGEVTAHGLPPDPRPEKCRIGGQLHTRLRRCSVDGCTRDGTRPQSRMLRDDGLQAGKTMPILDAFILCDEHDSDRYMVERFRSGEVVAVQVRP